ncbi:MAG TPA: transcriptional repressor LexA [Clostridiales bacterium]|nr:transcriptional repressor LexA [Clostridiales bacterium]
MEKVDQRRERIYRYIVERIEEGSAPSVREICQALSIKSTSTVHSDLKALAEKGLILLTEGLNRAIRLPGRSHVSVPLVGTVAAGLPILAVENIEAYLPISSEVARGRELFALRVQGESMKDAAILPGDLVVVEKCATAENGQIVVAMVEGEATVKRYYKENGHFRLQPENDAFDPLILDEVELLGRVISVIRYLE